MKMVILSTLIALLLIIGAIVASPNSSPTDPQVPLENVSIVDGVQIVEISAKGGYLPQRSTAKANIQTILRFETRGTFDCSSSVRIASMNISKILPSTGTTDIDIGVQPISTFQGSCGMGMYPFEIDFI